MGDELGKLRYLNIVQQSTTIQTTAKLCEEISPWLVTLSINERMSSSLKTKAMGSDSLVQCAIYPWGCPRVNHTASLNSFSCMGTGGSTYLRGMMSEIRKMEKYVRQLAQHSNGSCYLCHGNHSHPKSYQSLGEDGECCEEVAFSEGVFDYGFPGPFNIVASLHYKDDPIFNSFEKETRERKKRKKEGKNWNHNEHRWANLCGYMKIVCKPTSVSSLCTWMWPLGCSQWKKTVLLVKENRNFNTFRKIKYIKLFSTLGKNVTFSVSIFYPRRIEVRHLYR